MQTFQHEIAFIQKTFDQTQLLNGNGGFVENIVKKTATFNELSRTNKDQHKLHFKIISGYARIKDSVLDSDFTYDIATLFVKDNLVTNETDFTAADKEEFLNDSGALFNFSMWLLTNKITPFFSVLMQKEPK
jgi:hypothetical protein